MGRYTYQTFDPDELELPNDIDFDLEGIDGAYATYQEYEAYLPDMIGELGPVSAEALRACDEAQEAMERLAELQSCGAVGRATAWLLLLEEAVSSVRIENYHVSCESLLDCQSALRCGGLHAWGLGEQAALDAVEVMRDFVLHPSGALTLEELCEANGRLAQTSDRAALCGTLRERPVFIGRSLFDAEYVAPPADALEGYLDDLIRFVNGGGQEWHPIAKAALAQLQLVTVHPFEDGNGRCSRALAQRVLQTEGVARGFVLPTSTYALRDESSYVDDILRYRSGGGPSDPSAFVTFYATSCVSAVQWALQLGKQVTEGLGSWGRFADGGDGITGAVLEAFAETPVLGEAMLSS